MASCKAVAAPVLEAEEVTSDNEWVQVELYPDWVFVKPEEKNHADAAEGPDASGNEGDDAGDAASDFLYDFVCKEDPDAGGDGSKDQNTQKTQNDSEITENYRNINEGASGFSTRDESAVGFSHGACEINSDSGAHGFCEGACEGNVNKGGTRLSADDPLAHEHFFEDPSKEDENEGAHWVFDDESACGSSHRSVFSDGACVYDGDKDAHGHFNAESAHGSCEDARKEEAEKEIDEDEDHEEEEEEEEEELEEEESDEYSDALHEGALQDEINKHTNSLVDAMERYHTNPLRECWQEYLCSLQTEIRTELHETKMASFRGHGPEPEAFIQGSKCFNPLFEEIWLPWAINAQYCHNEDTGLCVCDDATGLTLCTMAAKEYMSSAVPILPVLEYMVNRAPSKKIAHVGSCSSLYWAALLEQLGATNVIVTEGSYPLMCSSVGYSHIKQIEEEMFFMLNMAIGQALFFLQPSKRSSDAQPCMAERCLFCFPGDTIFFIGERGNHTDNFDVAQWVEEHAHEGWHVETEMEIPCWPGSHDVFICITKTSLPFDITI